MNEIDVSYYMHSIYKIPLKDQKDWIARVSAHDLDGKLWSIALSQNKHTLGLETYKQRREYERMKIKEKEQVILKENVLSSTHNNCHIFFCRYIKPSMSTMKMPLHHQSRNPSGYQWRHTLSFT